MTPIAAAALLVLTTHVDTSVLAEPELHIGTREVDFGHVVVGPKVTRAYTIVNRGDATLRIHKAKPS